MTGTWNEPTLSAILEAIEAMRLEVSAVRPLVTRVEGIEARTAARAPPLATGSGQSVEDIDAKQHDENAGEPAQRQVPHRSEI